MKIYNYIRDGLIQLEENKMPIFKKATKNLRAIESKIQTVINKFIIS